MMHRCEHDRDDEDLRDLFAKIPDRFIVTEEELDTTVYAEYSGYIQRLAPHQPEQTIREAHDALCSPTTPLEVKREILARLAQRGAVEAYRAIERYAKSPDPSLAAWSKVALYECRMALESDLREESVGLISTGLGGAQHRLRYLVAVGLAHGPLREVQHEALESCWRTTCERHDSVLEAVRFQPDFVLLTLLVSMETTVGTVIDESIAATNTDIQFLQHEYFVTNTAIPTDEEIRRILAEISRKKTSQ